MNRILAADLWQSSSFGDPNERFQIFLKEGGAAFQNFIDSLIIHDEVVIPTQDFMVINILVGILGERNLRQIIENGALKFVRIKGTLAYAGSGGSVHGLCSLNLGSMESGYPHPYSMSADEALHWSFSKSQESTETLFLKTEIMESVTEVDISELLKTSLNHTNIDLTQSVLIRKFDFKDIAKGMLPNLPEKDVRIYESPNYKKKCDDVDLILHTAYTNIEIALADFSDCRNCSTSLPILSILQAKEETIKAHTKLDNFYKLREATSIPNLGRGIVERKIDFEKILRIRSSKEALEFRKWFHSMENNSNMGKEYIDVLRQESIIGSLSMRFLRLITTTSVGLANPLLGFAATATDSYLIPKIFGKHSVKYFVEKLHELGDYKVEAK